MNIFALDIYEEHDRCTFYTVRWVEDNDDEVSETERFFVKFYNTEEYKENILELIALLDHIGNNIGVNQYLFRHEGAAQGLPKNAKRLTSALRLNFANFPLRLYCLRVTDEVLILFNGGVKNAQTAQESDASMQFMEAQRFCKRIDEALSEREIRVEGKLIVSDYQENIEL